MLLPIGHGVGLLALGHGLLCPFAGWPLRLLRCSDVLAVHLNEGLPGQSLSW